MTSNDDSNYTFMLIPGGGNFTTRWAGPYGDRLVNVFSPASNEIISKGITGTDSGIAWSWAMTLQPGQKVTKTSGVAAGDINTYTLTLKANGGSGNDIVNTYIGGVSTELPPNPFTRDGYDFLGWAETSTGNIIYTDGAPFALSSNKILYANWGKRT